MRLTAFRIHPGPPVLRPASPRRQWMDETVDRFSYRCLPLTIANQYGWELLCPCSFEATWNGGKSPNSITVTPLGENQRGIGTSHFGEGVLTFHPGYLFRTPAPYQLLVTGPFNGRKDGAVPLTGVVETDWLPFTFTMNWALTRPGLTVRFEEGEPFCQVFPLHADLIEQVEPEIRDLSSEPELEAHFKEWSASRAAFNQGLATPNSPAREQGWQRFYTRGTLQTGQRPDATHRTRLAVRPFADEAEAQPSANGTGEAAG